MYIRILHFTNLLFVTCPVPTCHSPFPPNFKTRRTSRGSWSAGTAWRTWRAARRATVSDSPWTHSQRILSSPPLRPPVWRAACGDIWGGVWQQSRIGWCKSGWACRCPAARGRAAPAPPPSTVLSWAAASRRGRAQRRNDVCAAVHRVPPTNSGRCSRDAPWRLGQGTAFPLPWWGNTWKWGTIFYYGSFLVRYWNLLIQEKKSKHENTKTEIHQIARGYSAKLVNRFGWSLSKQTHTDIRKRLPTPPALCKCAWVRVE